MDAIHSVQFPHVAESSKWLDNLVWFNICSSGATELIRGAKAVVERLAVPIWVLSSASAAFTKEYGREAKWTNLQLDGKYSDIQGRFLDLISQIESQFYGSPVGVSLIGLLADMVQRPRAIQLMQNSQKNPFSHSQQVSQQAFAERVIHRAEIFPKPSYMDLWARQAVGELYERIKTLFMHSPMSKGMLRAEPGHVYVDNDHGQHIFKDVRAAQHFCLDADYSLMSLFRNTCRTSVTGIPVKSAEDYAYLIRNAWMFRIRVREGLISAYGAYAGTENVEVIPLKSEARVISESFLKGQRNIGAAKAALEKGYEAVLKGDLA